MARSGALSVYTKDIGPRTKWVFKLVFEDLLGLEVSITDEKPALKDGLSVLNYSDEEIDGCIRFTPAGLINDSGIKAQQINVQQFKKLPVFFETEGGVWPFDPFSMIFYMVSRYEEYLPFEADRHGRFSHEQSLAHKEGFLQIAIVDRLSLLIKELLLNKYSELKFAERRYRFIPTVDVDIAFAHLGKGFVRTYGAMAKLLLKGNLAEIGRRIKTMRGKAKDPFDNFDFLLSSFKKYGLDPVFFILAGDRGPYDRNLSLKNKMFARLVKEIAAEAELGVHPSYAAGTDSGRIKTEIGLLESLIGKEVVRSRQHFVRMKFPDTFRALIKNNIKEDYSMGYASISGFRAGIASPYYFYDLENEKQTNLKIHPFMFMDSTMEDYMNIDPAEYADAVKPFIDEVKSVKGTLIGIWHNYALADNNGKHKAFQKILEEAAAI